MQYKVGTGRTLSTAVTLGSARAPFLLNTRPAISAFRANRRRRRGAKPRVSGLRDSPAAGGWYRPHALPRARGFSLAPRARNSSRSHRVLGGTMWSRRSPPRGNSGGFAFDVIADPPAVLAPILNENPIGVEPRGEHASDVHAWYVRLHCCRGMPRHPARFVDCHAHGAQQREIRRVTRQRQEEIGGNRLLASIGFDSRRFPPGADGLHGGSHAAALREIRRVTRQRQEEIGGERL